MKNNIHTLRSLQQTPRNPAKTQLDSITTTPYGQFGTGINLAFKGGFQHNMVIDNLDDMDNVADQLTQAARALRKQAQKERAKTAPRRGLGQRKAN